MWKFMSGFKLNKKSHSDYFYRVLPHLFIVAPLGVELPFHGGLISDSLYTRYLHYDS